MTDAIVLTQEEREFARKQKISDNFLRLLLQRGHSLDDIPSFLHPSLDDMCAPYDIDGMKEAADRVKLAIKNKEKVLIFGDYDCDGIGAVSILTLYLRDKLDLAYFIPNRNTDGYGMKADGLKNILKQRRPSLIITVDCGITAVKEVDFLKSEGIDVIVTDHHEPQDVLPDCIIVDPKVKKQGFYDFCGAGVALKLVEALGGRNEMEKYLDIAAVSTIADVVPLLKDNRIIAYYGLKQIVSNPRKGIKELLHTDKLTAQDVMFKLAPRINAAGRMSTAMKAVELYLENDIFLLRSLCEELDRDNVKRQITCEQVVGEAKAMLKAVDFDKTRIIVLAKKGWEAGVLGIAAAKLTDEFKCPAILFAKNGDGLCKGSARSIKAVNIFELLSKFSDMFESFGGHSQAAGITISEEKFDEFAAKINAELLQTHDFNEFLPKIEYEMELDTNSDLLSFAKELQFLEPTGYGNPMPNFLIRANGLDFEQIGFTNHVKCSLDSMEIVAFSKFRYCVAATSGRTLIECSLGVNEFQNRQYAQAVVKTFQSETVIVTPTDEIILSAHHLSHEGVADLAYTSISEAEKLLEKPFGTVFVCFSQSEYETLQNNSAKIASLPVLVATPRCLNPENCTLILPAPEFDFSFYRNVIIAGRPLSEGYKKHIASQVKNCFLLGDCSKKETYIPDSQFREMFISLKKIAARREKMSAAKRLYRAVASDIKISLKDYIVIWQVFNELNLVTLSDRGIVFVSSQKTDLNNSVTYRNLKH